MTDRRKLSRGPIESGQLESSLGRALRGSLTNWGEGHRLPGSLHGWTYGQHGLAVGVYSQRSSSKVVSVFHRRDGRPQIRFSSYGHLANYLPEKHVEVDSWADFIEQRLGGDIRCLALTGSCPIELVTVESRIDELLRVLLMLR